jgi:hypothetical protein
MVAFGGLASGCQKLLYTVPLAAPSNWVASWDANGDGRLDLVMSHATGVNVDFLARGEHGMFSKTATPSPLAGIKVGGFAVGAFSGSNKDELAVLDTSVPTRLRILFYSRLGPAATPVWQVALGGAGAVALAAGDINGDGYDDLAVSVRDSNLGFGCITNGCILFVLGGASGPTLSPLSVSAGPAEGKRYDPAQPSIVDLNGDGKMDLVVPNLATREIVFIPGAGRGIFDQDNDVVLATTPQPPVRTGFADGTTQQLMLVVFLPGSGDHASGNYTREGRTGPFRNGVFFGSVDQAATTSVTAVVGLKMLGRADVAQSLGGGCAVIGDPKANSSDQVCPQSLLHQDFARNDVAEAPYQIDFGNVQVGETKTLTVTYRLALNTIWQSVGVGVAGPGDGPFQMVDLIGESHLLPRLRDSSTIVARFAPTGPGPFQRVIKLQTQGDEKPGTSPALGFTGGPISIVLRGVGVGGVVSAGTKQIGFAEEASKFADDGGVGVYKEFATLGAKVNRWTLAWDPASPERELSFLDRAVPAAQKAGVELILTVFPAKASNTGDPAGFCGWLKGVAARYPSLHRFVIGNEVNATRFWSPQHTAADQDAGPRSYYATLTRCYDALKSVNPSIQVIGMGLAPRSVDANSTKPLAFVRALGAIYKKDTARGATPIMDAVAVHPYPNPNVNPPPAPDNAKYEDADFYGIPQLDRVKQAVWDAFHGTAQKTTLEGLPIVIDEVGYQSDTTGKTGYTGAESSPVVSESNQAAYYARVVGLYACDPSVSDVLLFHLIDESQRNPDSAVGGWQSGLEYPDGSHKPSFQSVQDAIGLGCQGAAVNWKPSGAASGGGTQSSTAPPLVLTSSRGLSSFALVQAADGSLTWEADASAPSALTVAWAVRRDRSSSKVGVKGTKALASGAPIALSIENDLDPGHYLGTVKLAGAGGSASFNLDFVVAGTFSSTPKRSPLVGVRAGDGSLRWTFPETVPEAARVTPNVYRGSKLVLKGNASTLRDGDPVVLPLTDGLAPGSYSVRFLVRSAAKGSRGVDYVTAPFTVLSPDKPSVVWKRNAQGAAFWSSGTVAPKGGATLKVSWGSGSSVTRLQAGDPVSFYVDTTGLKPGRYTLRATISAPGGAGHDLGGQITLRVS